MASCENEPSRDLGLRDEALVRDGFARILLGLYGDGWQDDPHLSDTPKRAARAWYGELFKGITTEGGPDVTTFEADEDSGLIISRGIPVRSLCSHHLLPFIGEATVGYIPGRDEILGLSKLSRITDHFSRRPQVQERLTNQIADYLWGLVGAERPGDSRAKKGGAGVVIRARHMCMELRGVEHEGEMVTSSLRGVLKDTGKARAEFMDLAKGE